MEHTESRHRIGHLLDAIYNRFNKPEYIHPDPLELVNAYADPADREIAGLLSALLALGRVEGIISAASGLLNRFDNLRSELEDASDAILRAKARGFVYRFFREDHMVALLAGIRDTLRRHGSLNAAYIRARDLARRNTDDPEQIAGRALSAFVDELRGERALPGILLSDPAKTSACKRLHLFLRWMVRRDGVDRGSWQGVPPESLIVPMDTHMHRICRELGLTTRRQADIRAAGEVTRVFRRFCFTDPVKYDFALTRFGIHPALRRVGIAGSAA